MKKSKNTLKAVESICWLIISGIGIYWMFDKTWFEGFIIMALSIILLKLTINLEN